MTTETVAALTDGFRTPPHDMQAERAVIGLALGQPQLLDELVLAPADFYHPDHIFIWSNMVRLHAGGSPVTPTTLNALLQQQDPHEYQRHGGASYLFELVEVATTEQPAAATFLARIIRDHARRRQVLQLGQRLLQVGSNADPDDLLAHAVDMVDALARDEVFGRAPQHSRLEFITGGSFILDTSPDAKALWGRGEDCLLADGESLIVAARAGLGKTTLGQQLALGRCGIPEYSELLGYPIEPGQRRTLYLAMDRPRQIARSFRRMVGEAYRDELDRKLVVWQGPPPADLAKHPDDLLALCEAANADTVIIDSLKDAAVGLSEDDVGAGYNRARQKAITAGVQVIKLHHNRKELAGAGKDAKVTIDDLYGSTWVPAGAGSVIILTGSPGDPIVGLHHVKQPSREVGPLQIMHDHDRGRSSVHHAADLVSMASVSSGGITARDAAASLYSTDKPRPAEVERARRRLDQLVEAGKLDRIDGDRPTSTPARWIPVFGAVA